MDRSLEAPMSQLMLPRT
ncbi:hypothetical protein M6B38_233335 [Iris pallida]|uniref:Uncharacterized protein n=1 Tax=Iris pallida TaxID=29817 RepID=A0AAX6DQL2_IRIPA|nr:hypothetical protein M6B38_233335 [Iris pallida]